MASFVGDCNLSMAHADSQGFFPGLVVQDTGCGTDAANQQRESSTDPPHDPTCSTDGNTINIERSDQFETTVATPKTGAHRLRAGIVYTFCCDPRPDHSADSILCGPQVTPRPNAGLENAGLNNVVAHNPTG